VKIAVLGTGVVGQTLAGRLAALGHQVTVGTRDPEATLARTAPQEGSGTPAFDGATVQAELIINATGGGVSLEALAAAGAANLDGKVILDVANTLDFSNGFPPSLSVVTTDSLAEQIQRAHPAARVVKSLSTMSCQVMVDPARVPGEHAVFVSGAQHDLGSRRSLHGPRRRDDPAVVALDHAQAGRWRLQLRHRPGLRAEAADGGLDRRRARDGHPAG
jgi:hypothetical protein